MSRHPLHPGFEDLPDEIPIFPLPGALLLPGGRLPLNIFEPRYLAMVDDALVGARLIGMIQPCGDAGQDDDVGAAAVYRTGCAGRLVAFNETDDGRYLSRLAGLIRFDVTEELAGRNGYRRVRPDWRAYAGDLEPCESVSFDRERLLAALGAYFEATGIAGDWDSIAKAEDEPLITTLAMACPFQPNEKQALLEARSLAERAEAMTAILEMTAYASTEDTRRH